MKFILITGPQAVEKNDSWARVSEDYKFKIIT